MDKIYRHFLVFLCAFFSVQTHGEGKAFPTDGPQEILGMNIGGLKADLKTDLFSADGPFAQLGNEIAAGASQLENELKNSENSFKAELNNAINFLGQGSQEEIAGVNIGGLHAGLKTNIFSKTGPLAQIGGDLTAGAKAIEDNIQKEANALGASLTEAANALQANLQGSADFINKGLQDLGSQITASGGASMDNLFNMGGSLDLGASSIGSSSKSSGTSQNGATGRLARLFVFDSPGTNGNAAEKDTLAFFGDNSELPGIGASGLNVFGQISGQPQSQEVTKTVTVTSGQPGGGLSGFTINTASDQKPAQGSSSGSITIKTSLQGGGGAGQSFTLTPEILAEIMKKINLPDMCKALKK